MYRDPNLNSPGKFWGTSFFISFFENNIETHVPPSGTFLEISTQMTENAFLFYFDTNSSQWIKNCIDPVKINDGIRVELCHATQYAIFQLTFDVSSAPSSDSNTTIIVVIVVVLVVVISALGGVLVYYRKKIKVKRWEFAGK